MEFVKRKKIAIIVGVLIIGIVVTVLLTRNAGLEKYDLFENTEMSFEGIDGEGHAIFNSNIDAFESKLLLKHGEKNVRTLMEMEKISDQIKFNVTPYEKLKNGDKVTVTLEFPQDTEKNLGFKFTSTEKTYTVANLKEPINISKEQLFAGLEVKIEGEYPNVKVILNNTATEEFFNKITYSFKESRIYFKGQKLEVEANVINAKDYGYLFPEGTSKEIELTDMDTYLSDPNTLKEDSINKINEICEKELRKKLDDHFSFGPIAHPGRMMFPNSTEYSDIKLEEIITVSLKEEEIKKLNESDSYFDRTGNITYIVYSFIANDDVYNNPTKIFVMFEIPEVIEKNDGSIEFKEEDVYLYGSKNSKEEFEERMIPENPNKYNTIRRPL